MKKQISAIIASAIILGVASPMVSADYHSSYSNENGSEMKQEMR